MHEVVAERRADVAAVAPSVQMGQHAGGEGDGHEHQEGAIGGGAGRGASPSHRGHGAIEDGTHVGHVVVVRTGQRGAHAVAPASGEGSGRDGRCVTSQLRGVRSGNVRI